MTKITLTVEALAKTIDILRIGGARSEERVVLWLAPVSVVREPLTIVEVYEPEQITDVDYFRLPPGSLRALMAHLRTARLKIVAQVHSHPGEAFHSDVDDEWAIIRQVGALSLVLPRFARDTTPENFVEQAATYELSVSNEWIRIPNKGPTARIETIL